MAVNGSVGMLASQSGEELFRRSYNALQRYPRHLIYKNCSEYSLKAYAKMLKSREEDLFGPVEEAVVPMIDLKMDHKGMLPPLELLHS
jgi:hypothetical protein